MSASAYAVYAGYINALAPAYGYVPSLLAPRWPSPVGFLDLYSAHRLSVVVNWIATDFGKGKGKKRASAVQEMFGILVVLFGGETFLAMCTGTPPSWLIDPSLGLVFAGIHLVQTRTPLVSLLPARPNYRWELFLSIPDAIGRTLLLTRFSVVPLLNGTSPTPLPPTPSTLLLVPWILAVPAAAFIFTATNCFSPTITLTTPMELQPWGWTALDAWLPIVLPSIFLSLVGPLPGWPIGLDLNVSEDGAIVACAFIASVCFVVRTWWNLAPKSTSKRSKKAKKE